MSYNTTQKEAAQAVGMDRSRLSRLVRDGIVRKSIRKVPGKKCYRFDVEKLKVELEANLDQTNRGRRGKRPGEKLKPTEEEKQQVIEQAALGEEESKSGGMSFSRAREVNENYKAALKKLEYEEKKGELIRAADVESRAFEAGKQIKEQLSAIPHRVAALVAAEKDTFKCRQIIAKEVNYVLDNLSKILWEDTPERG